MSQVYADSINGNPIYAARAEQDQNGLNIDQTYAKKSEIPTFPVQDVEYNGTSVVNAQGVAEIPAPSYPVTDVTLDGTSVVSNGVAALTSPTTDQTYNASSTNPQSGTAVAGAIAGVRQVPASTSTDSGKVLKVNASGTPEWQTGGGGGGGTVDQTYDPTSTNAQSGTAVAGALATVNQVPASTASDEGKILKVDASGNPEWATGGGGTQIQADWTQTDSSAVDYIKNKPSLAAVATSGSYNDLSNKPTIPTLATLNTAGITDIQVVSSLPSNPVSTVLYLVTG